MLSNMRLNTYLLSLFVCLFALWLSLLTELLPMSFPLLLMRTVLQTRHIEVPFVDFGCSVMLADDFMKETSTGTVFQQDELCIYFEQQFLGKHPVVLKNLGLVAAKNKHFKEITEKDHLLETYGDLPIKISTANAHTGKEWVWISVFELIFWFC